MHLTSLVAPIAANCSLQATLPSMRDKNSEIVPSPHFTVDDFSLHQQVLARFHGLNSEFTLYPRTTPIGPGNGALSGPACIYLDKHMLCEVYEGNGICVRNHCGAEPPRHTEPPSLVTTVGWRDRASTSYAAADRFKALASPARGRFRRIHRGRTAPSLPSEACTASGT